ncbi:RHS repeat domain-containing protein [Neolewinella sp.]|uniref:RHS repeat domain-containing protein n=1 Tax=Neolewinella sp. TaxID=2993543 RepID=UPI003B51CEF4
MARSYLTIGFVQLIFCCVGLWSNLLMAQGYSDHPSTAEEGFQRFTYLRNNAVVPAAPEAAALSAHVDVDVSHYTGTLNYSLPIEQLKGHKIGMDFSLHYRGSANKVSELPGWVGLGWTLQGGGVITRTVRGAPDGTNYYGKSSDISKLTSNTASSDLIGYYNVIYNAQLGYLETQPDLYQINYPGGSGTFFISPDKQVFNRASESHIITPTFDSQSKLTSFTVTDENGTVYVFDKVETSRITVNTSLNGGEMVGVSGYVYPSAWHLSSIRSYDGRETITLSYLEDANEVNINSATQSLEVWNYQLNTVYGFGNACLTSGNPDFCGPNVKVTSSGGGAYSAVWVTGRRWLKDATLSRGGTTTGKVELVSSAFNKSYGTYSYSGRRLDALNIYKNGSSTSVTHNFTYDESTGRLTLKNYKSPYHPSTKPYVFTYSGGTLPSDVNSRYIDHWGYYTSNSVSSLTPKITLCDGRVFTAGNANRQTSSSNVKAGIMTKVSLPTGGRLEFDYEAHQVPDWSLCGTISSAPIIPGGGVRIQRIREFTTATGTTAARTRSFTYEKAGTSRSSGLVLARPKYDYTTSFQTYSQPSQAIEVCDPPPVFSCNRLSIQSQSIKALRAVDGSYVGYSRVTETNAGKTVYTFINDEFNDVEIDKPNNGKLIQRLDYDDQNKLIVSHGYAYSSVRSTTSLTKEVLIKAEELQDNKIFLCRSSTGTYTWRTGYEVNSACASSNVFKTKFRVNTLELYATSNVPVRDTIKEFFYPTSGAAESITKVRYHSYKDTRVLKPTEVYYVNSDQKKFTTKTYYANTPGNPVANLTAIQNEKLVGMPLVQDFLVGTTLRYRSQLLMESVALPGGGGTHVYVKKVQDGFNGNTVADREEVQARDMYGNITQARNTYDIPTTYIWDRTGGQISAAIRGGTVQQCAFTSFEEPLYHGGWTASNTSGNSPYYVTTPVKGGKRASNQLTLTKSGLPADKYIVSYWTKAASNVAVSGSGVTVSRTIASPADGEGWVYVERVITASANASVRVDITGTTDEVRLYPFSGMMTTYTQDPTYNRLTAMGDENGQLQRFDYDSYYRLASVKDFDGNIVMYNAYMYDAGGQAGINSVTSYRPLTSGMTSTSTVTAASTSSLSKIVSYVDGLGRAVQTVDVAGGYSTSSTKNDIVSFSVYDEFGRQTKNYLPLVTATDGGTYRSDVVTKQSTFYTGKFGTADGPKAYTELGMLKAPIGRLMSERGVGSALNSRPTVYVYRVNKANEVRQFATASGWYAAGELLVVKQTDSDGRTSTTFTDKAGRKVREDHHTSKTYYLYDDLGNPTYVITPEGSEKGHTTASYTISTTAVKNNAFWKTYSSTTNLMTSSRTPGQSTSTTAYYYDRLDRLVLTKLPTGQSQFVKYDLQGRQIMTGVYKGTALPTTSQALYEKESSSTVYKYTINQAFPISDLEIYSVAYYDDYDFDGTIAVETENAYVAPPSAFTSFFSGISAPSAFARGLQTGERVSVINASNTVNATPHIGVMHYDRRGRLVQVNKTHYLSGKDVYWYQYDFSGNRTRSRRSHTKNPSWGISETVVINQTYQYDRYRHPTTTTHQMGDSGVEVLLSGRQYDELGNLKQKTVGRDGVSDATWAQTLDYSYNIQGWPTGINQMSGSLSDGNGGDLFALKLNYYNQPSSGSGTLQYSGNVSSTEWKTIYQNSPHTYSYTYDELSRLKAANYRGGSTAEIDRYTVDNLTYDLNGNIKTLRRRGKLANGTYGIIDQLTYAYDVTNSFSDRLLSVTEAGSGTAGYLGPQGTAATFTYDALGNTLSQPNKGITKIDYTIFNLPRQIQNSAGQYQMAYDGLGKKIVQVDPATNKRTDYVDGIEIVDGSIQSIYHEEGRVVRESNKWVYEYVLRDHQGNTRILFRDHNGYSEVRATYAYYPFGMQNEGLKYEGPSITPYNFRYGGKEIAGGLGLSDFGARWYDASLGRWMGVDPMATSLTNWSPYNYTYNNPVNFTDPTGMYPYPSAEDYELGRARLLEGSLEFEAEPATNQAGTIEQAIDQWKAAGLNTLEGINGFVRNKNIDGNGTAAVRYVYTGLNGWIDLSHYILVHQAGEATANILEPLSGDKILQAFVFGTGADKSYYSYEDLPTNAFASSGPDLASLAGSDKIYLAILSHFNSAKSTFPENAPNYKAMPADDQDRKRLPETWVPSIGGQGGAFSDRTEMLMSGRYVPQNHSSEPYSLRGFTPAPTSILGQR